LTHVCLTLSNRFSQVGLALAPAVMHAAVPGYKLATARMSGPRRVPAGLAGCPLLCAERRAPGPGIVRDSALSRLRWPAPGVSWRPSRVRGDGVPGRHEAPKDSDPLIGLVVLGLMVLLAVTIILAVI
jgi:hypothetical protein